VQLTIAIGTVLRVTYTEREGIKAASRVVQAAWSSRNPAKASQVDAS
jgi:hypothetical protein